MNFFLWLLYYLFSWSYICFLFLSFRSTHSNPLYTREKCILTHNSAVFYPYYYAYYYLCCVQRCQISLTSYVVDWWCSFFIQLIFIFIIYILTGLKNKSHCLAGLENSEYLLSEFRYYNDKWGKKVRPGVDIFDKRIFDSWFSESYFRIRPRLQQSFPRSRAGAEYKPVL